MATAAEIQAAAQAVIDAQAALNVATAAFNVHESAALASVATEQTAAQDANAVYYTALQAARDANPDWTTTQQGATDAQLAHAAAIVALSEAASSYDGQ